MSPEPIDAHPVFDGAVLEGIHLLEADAGTGKTWTIAGLVVRAIVERDLDIERVLVLTFTNAATAELAARIRQRIAQLERLLDDRIEGRSGPAGAAIDEPFCVAYAARLDDEAAHRARSALRMALARVDEMAVHTIHGYCQRVIDEHALSIGVARALPIRTGPDEGIARRVAGWWRAEVLDAPPERLLLVELAELSPAELEQAVRAIAALPLARVEPPMGDWRALASQIHAQCRSLAEALRDEGDALRLWLAAPGNVDRRRFPESSVPGWLAALRSFCEGSCNATLPEDLGRFATHRFERGAPPSRIPGCCDALIGSTRELASVRGWIAREIAASLDATRERDLAEAASLGFDDLLRLVRDALVDPMGGAALARALRERHPVALIDECQDTDALQWEILRRIHVDAPLPCAQRGARAGALILVGDPKQAIYAFRGADLHSYLQAREAAGRRHRLGENQRSSRALIESVNALFDRPVPFLVEEIRFEPAVAGARPRRSFEPSDGARRAPMTLVRLEPDPATGLLDAVSARRQSVQACAAEIARLLSGGSRYDDRTLRPRDIAVLVQTHRQGAQIKQALAAAGIGAAEISRDSVLATLECAELVRVIAAIAEPADPARLRSALATTLFGADAATLDAGESSASAWLAYAAHFARARERWDRTGPLGALRPLFREHGVAERLARLRDGDRRLTNLMHLMALLVDHDAAARSASQALQAWTRLRSGDVRDPETGELRLESDDDLVRIVTVHKSKGLEFPIVFLPFAWSGKPAAASRPCMRHERDEAGRWQAVLDFAPSPESDAQAARERQAENLRTLYVALTRAEHRCYVFFGATRNAQHAPLAWLLHGSAGSAQGGRPAALAADAIEQALAQWRDRANARHDAAVAIVDTPTLAAREAPSVVPTRGALPSMGVEAPAARPWRGVVGAASITTSFSAMARMIEPHTSSPAGRLTDLVDRPDHDQQATFDAPADDAARDGGTITRAMRFRFPAGAQAGICLHGILQEAAIDAPPAIELVTHWLARSGLARHDAREVAAWLAQVLATPLTAPHGASISLAQVPAAKQLRELDFHLSGRDVSDRAVLEAVSAEFPLDAPLDAPRWSGFLRGFIDLVFEHAGRYYLLDWKSNHLGDHAARYDRASLEAAMRRHAYTLQGCLYTLALHRWLRRSVQGYDYDRHFGGVFYVFLRGAGLEAQAADRPGVHASRPSAGLVDALDRLFGAPEAGLHSPMATASVAGTAR